jgi:cobalt/nickel transport system permease protein
VHHVVLERWSRGSSPLHRRDPRAKIAALLLILLALTTNHQGIAGLSGLLLLMLLAGVHVAGLPVRGVAVRAGTVLPFAVTLAAISWFSGDAARAGTVVIKSYLSAFAVLLVAGTTPLPALLLGFERLGLPRFPIMVAQFIYRYLFLISEEGQHMAMAASARGATLGTLAQTRARWRAASGALAVLFARSYSRAGEIHRAMLARSFDGSFRSLTQLRFGLADGLFLGVTCAYVAGAWLLTGKVL